MALSFKCFKFKYYRRKFIQIYYSDSGNSLSHDTYPSTKQITIEIVKKNFVEKIKDCYFVFEMICFEKI